MPPRNITRLIVSVYVRPQIKARLQADAQIVGRSMAAEAAAIIERHYQRLDIEAALSPLPANGQKVTA